jgi:phosphinothricin acetyltransferase
VEWSIYVDETKRGKGVGAALTQSMIDRCSKLNYHVLIGRISEGNEASVRIHAKFGFEVCGVMKELGYKWGQWRNVVIMQKILNASPAPSQ